MERNTVMHVHLPGKVDIVFRLSNALVALRQSTFTIAHLKKFLIHANTNIKKLQEGWNGDSMERDYARMKEGGNRDKACTS